MICFTSPPSHHLPVHIGRGVYLVFPNTQIPQLVFKVLAGVLFGLVQIIAARTETIQSDGLERDAQILNTGLEVPRACRVFGEAVQFRSMIFMAASGRTSLRSVDSLLTVFPSRHLLIIKQILRGKVSPTPCREAGGI